MNIELEFTTEEAEQRRCIGQITLPVRFFAYGEIDGDLDLVELTESEFLDIKAPIEYERHSVFENGVNQITLTKRNV